MAASLAIISLGCAKNLVDSEVMADRLLNAGFTKVEPELPSMMIAHVLIPEIDAELPTSLSPALVRDFLRTQLGYNGIIFTDDLCMGAIAKQYTPAQSVALALRAGCDLPLVCHNACEHLESIAEAIAQLPEDILEEVERRVNAFRFPLSARPPMTFIEWHDYLADNRAFNAEVPSLDTPAPGSPVQDYWAVKECALPAQKLISNTMKKLLFVLVPLCGMVGGADDVSGNDFTLECLHPQSEAKADILFTQNLFLLKLYGQTIEEVETALHYNGYVIAPENSEVHMCVAREIILPDDMQRYAVVISPAKACEFYILYYRWDGKVHRLDSHAVYSYHHVPQAGALP